MIADRVAIYFITVSGHGKQKGVSICYGDLCVCGIDEFGFTGMRIAAEYSV